METQLGAAGDFAWAYVIAHEVGHHVQRQLGTSEEVTRLQRDDPSQANALSVRLELQADCYAGVWAHSVFAAGDIDKGDLGEAIRASAAVRRRPASAQGRRPGEPGLLHARQLRAAHGVVQHGSRERRAGRLRHVLA
jgi:predicted metalloprotease